MRLAIIINPRVASAHQAINDIGELLNAWEADLFRPSTPLELEETCAQLDKSCYQAAVVVGGDGSVNRALRGLLKSGVPLYPYPGGTANDLASSLGIKADWAQARRLLQDRSITERRLLEVNGVPFATIAGVGIGADVVREFNERRWRSRAVELLTNVAGSSIYTLLTMERIASGPSLHQPLHFVADSAVSDLDVIGAFVCNQRTLGGRFTIISRDECSSESFGGLVLTGTTRMSAVNHLVALRVGMRGVGAVPFAAERLTIAHSNKHPIQVFGDGEILLEAETLTFARAPLRLRLYCDWRWCDGAPERRSA
jgi:diacylglycerol kinase family enzyme